MSYEQKLVDEKLYARFLLGDRGKHAVREFFRLLMELEKLKEAFLVTDDHDQNSGGKL